MFCRLKEEKVVAIPKHETLEEMSAFDLNSSGCLPTLTITNLEI